MENISRYRSLNILKTGLLFALFFGVIIGAGWFFADAYGNASILWIAAVFSIGMSAISYWFSDTIVLRLAGAKLATAQSYPELYRIVGHLTREAHLSMPKLYVIDEQAPNAFATGRSAKRAAVAVTKGLLERLNEVELEAVLAHELSHVGNRDMLVSTIAVVLVGFVSLAANFFTQSLFFQSVFGGNSRNRNRNDIAGIISLAAAILLPIAAALIQLAISRKRELLADASGALLTRHPEHLASALEKIGTDPTPLRAANTTTAHLWISDPFRNRQRLSPVYKLFLTHPPIAERVAALRRMKL